MDALAVHEGAAAHEAHAESFVRHYIFSLDHKMIGKQYYFTTLFMALIGGALAMLMRRHLGWPEQGTLDPGQYLAAATMHGTIMIFFFLTSILTGAFGNFLIPLMIGARDMAFPFLNMVSFWTLVPGVLVLLSSFFVPGGPAGDGWTSYAPLSAVSKFSPGSGLGQTLWAISILFVLFSSLFGSLNFLTTIINMRARGLSMGRIPLTLWGIFITAILALLSFPVLTAAIVMLILDRTAGTSFFVPPNLLVAGQVLGGKNGDALLWQHLFWFFGHPEVYILILTPMGIVSDVISTFSRKPIFGYKAMVLSLSAIGFLSFLVWGHHMFVSGMSPLLGAAFIGSTIAIAVPSAIKTFNWCTTLWQGRLHFTSAMLFAIAFVSLFVTGGLSGIFLATAPVDIYLHDTYFVIAHFHFVMAAAALFSIFAGTYYWFPKLFGRMMDERLGKIHFVFTFLGIYMTFFPMHFLGFMGNSRRLYSTAAYPFLDRAGPIDIFISLSAFMLGAAQVVFIYNFFKSLLHGPVAEQNPWHANSLEWAAPSPPPHGNWGPSLPVVYRWPYDYSVPDAPADYSPMWQADPVPAGGASPAGDGGGE
ncbi:MAG TPA: cbb3-type cytochrome c oxidase subunit I [bacterium]|nr:cbb3-type cytochrome c oxidase subunit I [bacterium]